MNRGDLSCCGGYYAGYSGKSFPIKLVSWKRQLYERKLDLQEAYNEEDMYLISANDMNFRKRYFLKKFEYFTKNYTL